MPALLAPVIFVRSREPFDRLVVILELVLGRTAGRDSARSTSAGST
jgi:hypothetical protein